MIDKQANMYNRLLKATVWVVLGAFVFNTVFCDVALANSLRPVGDTETTQEKDIARFIEGEPFKTVFLVPQIAAPTGGVFAASSPANITFIDGGSFGTGRFGSRKDRFNDIKAKLGNILKGRFCEALAGLHEITGHIKISIVPGERREETGIVVSRRGAVVLERSNQDGLNYFRLFIGGKTLSKSENGQIKEIRDEIIARYEQSTLRPATPDDAAETSPAVEDVWVCITKEEVADRRESLLTGKFPFKYLGVAHVLNATAGFVEIFADKITGKVLGAHINGAHAKKLARVVSLAKHLGATMNDLADLVIAHPTLVEAIGEAAEAALHKSIHLMPDTDHRKKPVPQETYDVWVVGSGPGGYPTAIRAAQLGMKVAIIEKGEFGGTCLNVGCISTKAILKIIDKATDPQQLELSKIRRQRDAIVRRLREGLRSLLEANGVVILKRDFDIRQFKPHNARNLVLALGSEPLSAIPGVVTIDHKRIIDTNDALKLKKVPDKITIYGGGPNGLEFLTIFSKLGCGDITVIEKEDQICPSMLDEDMAGVVQQRIEKPSQITFKTGEESTSEDIPSDGIVLVTAGRKPNTDSLRSDGRIALTDNGKIIVDSDYRARITGESSVAVYAIGDAIEGPQLAPKASGEGIRAAEIIADQIPQKEFNYNEVPSVIFSDPEVAAVGLTEKAARDAGMDIDVKYSSERDNFTKVVLDKASRVVLGFQTIGPAAPYVIAEMTLAVKMKAKLDQLIGEEHIFSEPPISEFIPDATAETSPAVVDEPLETHGQILDLLAEADKKGEIPEGGVVIINADAHEDMGQGKYVDKYVDLFSKGEWDMESFRRRFDEIFRQEHSELFKREPDAAKQAMDLNWDEALKQLEGCWGSIAINRGWAAKIINISWVHISVPSYTLEEILHKFAEDIKTPGRPIWLTVDYDLFSWGITIDSGSWVEYYHFDGEGLDRRINKLIQFLTENSIELERVVPCISRAYLSHRANDAYIEGLTAKVKSEFGKPGGATSPAAQEKMLTQPIEYIGKGKLDAILHFTKGARQYFPQSVIEKIGRIATWEDFSPDDISGRRSALIWLPKPIEIHGRVIRAIKIKGVCFRPEEFGEPGLPNLQLYEGAATHTPPHFLIRFNDNGLIRYPPASTRFSGLESFDNAFNEWMKTLEAFYEGMPVNYPLGYGEYDPKRFRGFNAGFVILGIEDKNDSRLSRNILNEVSSKLGISRLSLSSALLKDRDPSPFEAAGKEAIRNVVHNYFYRYGRTLRTLHDGKDDSASLHQGYIHGSPHHGNISITSTEVFHDLDESSYFKNELTPNRLLGYQVIDLCKVSYDVQQNLSRGHVLGDLCYHSGAECLRFFLRGYLHDFDAEIIDGIDFTQLDDVMKMCKITPIQNVSHPIVMAVKTILARQPFHIAGIEITIANNNPAAVFELANVLLQHRGELEIFESEGISKITVSESDINKPGFEHNLGDGTLNLKLASKTLAPARAQLEDAMNEATRSIIGVTEGITGEVIEFHRHMLQLRKLLYSCERIPPELRPLFQLFYFAQYYLRIKDEDVKKRLLSILREEDTVDVSEFYRTLTSIRGAPIHEKFAAMVNLVKTDKKCFGDVKRFFPSLDTDEEGVTEWLTQLWSHIMIDWLSMLVNQDRIDEAYMLCNNVTDEHILPSLMSDQSFQHVTTSIRDSREHIFYQAMLYDHIAPEERPIVFRMWGRGESGGAQMLLLQSLSEQGTAISRLFAIKRLYLEGLHRDAAAELRELLPDLKHPNVFVSVLAGFIGVDGMFELMNIIEDPDKLWTFVSNFRTLDLPEIPQFRENTENDPRYAEAIEAVTSLKPSVRIGFARFLENLRPTKPELIQIRDAYLGKLRAETSPAAVTKEIKKALDTAAELSWGN